MVPLEMFIMRGALVVRLSWTSLELATLLCIVMLANVSQPSVLRGGRGTEGLVTVREPTDIQDTTKKPVIHPTMVPRHSAVRVKAASKNTPVMGPSAALDMVENIWNRLPGA